MKHLLLLLMAVCPIVLFAQKGKTKKAKNEYPSWFASAQFSFQSSHVAVKEDANWDLWYADRLYHQSGSGRAGGIQVGYAFNKKLDVQLGAIIGKQSIIQTSDFPIAYCNPVDYGAKEQVGANRFVTIKTVEIPAELRYKFFIGKGFSMYPALGGLLVFTTNKKQDVEVYMDNGAVATHSDNDFDLENDRPVNVAVQAKMGFRLQVAKPIFVKVEPFYKWYLAKEQLLSEFGNTRLRSFGISAGLEYAILFRKE